ncbi:sigma-70 family RNA polymerase sigma factor [Sandaracinobacter neustonicus]|nr:sigma-70 family RNA polymerase sigma factor [Sandaracinobacter neustonicus]
MGGVSDDRALWLARHILPHELSLRTYLARWKLPQDLDADDVIQECYSRFAQMDDVGHLRNPRAYLFSISRTIILMHIRHARVISIRSVDDGDLLWIAADEPSPETQVSDREQLHLLAIAVSELPEPGRRAFLSRVIDGMSHREIGAQLGMSDNAVQKLVAKSLQRLMIRMGRGGNAQAGASTADKKQARERNERTRDERRD